MKTASVLAALVIGGSCARAEIAFQGYATIAGRSVFVFSVDKEKTSGWLSIGQSFEGVSLVAFDAKTEVLTIEKDGERRAIHIADGKIQTANEGLNSAERKLIVILIGATERISVGDDAATIAALKTRLKLVAAMNPQPIVNINASSDVSFDRMRFVFDLCRAAGITRMTLGPQSP